MALPTLALHPALVKVIRQTSTHMYITAAKKQQFVKTFDQNIRFTTNALSYPSAGNFIFVFPTITA
jgi:hypothetical protein